MALLSPIQELHAQAGALCVDYGLSEPQKVLGEPDTGVIPVVGTYGELALEYAALRRQCVILDLAHRATLQLSGPETQAFLNRMLTQEFKDIAPGEVRRSFWLNRKGRIDADLRVARLDDRFILEVDALAAHRACTGLARYVIMEDVKIEDQSLSCHRLALHGPTAADLLSAAGGPSPAQGHIAEGVIADRKVVIYREDTCGVSGYELIVATDDVKAVFETLVQLGHDPHHGAEALRIHGAGSAGSRIKLRPAGWYAYNIARIEAGTPWYNLDFGPNSIPAETGVMLDRLSLKKGCYLGQEIVARLVARGNPKQILRAFALSESGMDRPLPGTGAALRDPATRDVVGSVTSSTYSPMLGAQRIGFAMVRFDASERLKDVTIATDAGDEPAALQPHLQFLPAADA